MMKTVEKNKKQVSESAKINQTLSEAEAIIVQANSIPKKRSKVFIIIALILLCILVIAFTTVFGLLTLWSDKIVSGISIYNVDVSSLTIEEAKQKLNEYIQSKADKTITLVHNDFSGTVTLSQLNIDFDIDNAVSEAYTYGRSGNIFENNFQVLDIMYYKKNITPKLSQNDEIINKLATNLNQNFTDLFLDPSYYIDASNLIIVNGKDGIATDEKGLLNELILSLEKSLEDDIVIDVPVLPVSAKPVDIDTIYKEVHKDPTDAYYMTDPYIVYPSSTGIDFNISLEDVKKMLQTEQEQYTIPLKTLYPKVSTNDIGVEAFPNLLSEFSTSFASSNSNRSTNISLAAAKINGIVLMPGDTFSYNQTVGQRTTSAGFKSAPAYLNGQVVQETGGGICQVSSTLYNAVLYANLEIVERQNHTFKPTYVKPGLDATVSWGGPDFKFKNNRDYPIKIVTDTSGKIVRTYIYGLKKDSDYVVKLRADYLSTVYPKTVTNYTSSLAKGVKRTVSGGSSGCKTATYKILYDQSGNYISTEKISSDTYSAHNTVVEVGR